MHNWELKEIFIFLILLQNKKNAKMQSSSSLLFLLCKLVETSDSWEFFTSSNLIGFKNNGPDWSAVLPSVRHVQLDWKSNIFEFSGSFISRPQVNWNDDCRYEFGKIIITTLCLIYLYASKIKKEKTISALLCSFSSHSFILFWKSSFAI